MPNPNKDLDIAYYAPLVNENLEVGAQRLRAVLEQMAYLEEDRTYGDVYTRKYYLNHGSPVWVSRCGVDHRADTLLAFLRGVDSLGFSFKAFGGPQIEEALKRMRSLDFGNDDKETISQTLGKLEYLLTKAWLRLAIGQRFGYVNPDRLLNKLDVKDSDSVHVSYNRVFDVAIERADESFCQLALHKVLADSIGLFLRSLEPTSKQYGELANMLRRRQLKGEERMRVICNMERARWRLKDSPEDHERYVLVNVPSFHLYAVNKKQVTRMRVGCGSVKTKTPLLTSGIERMDVNPKWYIPQSIIDKDIARHAGDMAYFARHRYQIMDRKTGKACSPTDIDAQQLRSKRYAVVQEGGDGNSLGRIIFRFPNQFSVFLHDTSNPGVFGRDNRGVSHGCVRVENPYELAAFLLNGKDEVTLRKVAYSMKVSSPAPLSSFSVSRSTLHSPLSSSEDINQDSLVNTVKINPSVPVFITYWTLFQEPEGAWITCKDIYGYDKAIWRGLRYYMDTVD